jgi:DNA end-binding protein Ku
MARAMWKASLRLGDYELPVKLYAAVEDRGVRFRLLHAADQVPVTQRLVDPATGAEVSSEEVRRGLELDRGVYVLLRPDELAKAEPKPSRAIEVKRFVPRKEIDLAWYSRPYLLGPDGRGEEYFALARALEDSGRYGVARWVMRGKRYFGALGPREGRLALLALRTADEVVAADQLAPPRGPEVRKNERELAEQLVSALDGPFEPETLRDEHRERVLELIEAKAEGRRVREVQGPAPKPTGDLTEALRASLRAARERRVA